MPRSQCTQKPQLDLGVAIVVRAVQIGGRSNDGIDFQVADAVEALGVRGHQQGRLGQRMNSHDVASHRSEPGGHVARQIRDDAVAFASLSKTQVATPDEIRARNKRRHGSDGSDGRQVGVLAIQRVEPAPQSETGIQGVRCEKLALTERSQVGLNEVSVRSVPSQSRWQGARQVLHPSRQPEPLRGGHRQNPHLGIDEILKHRVEFTVETLPSPSSDRQRSRPRARERIQDAERIGSEGVQHLLDEFGGVAFKIGIPVVQRLRASSTKRRLYRIDESTKPRLDIRQQAELGALRASRRFPQAPEAERVEADPFAVGCRPKFAEAV